MITEDRLFNHRPTSRSIIVMSQNRSNRPATNHRQLCPPSKRLVSRVRCDAIGRRRDEIDPSYIEVPLTQVTDGFMRYSLDLASQVLRQTPLTLKALLSDLSDEWTRESEGPGAWTPHEAVGHLTFVEESDWIDRTRIILEHGTNRVFEAIDREAGFERFRGSSLPDLLERFAEVRNANLLLLESLVLPENIDKLGVHPDFGEVRLDQLLSAWVVHDLNHIDQIVKTMAKQYAKAVGPWRAYLPIIDAP